jgi:hypothetical protein
VSDIAEIAKEISLAVRLDDWDAVISMLDLLLQEVAKADSSDASALQRYLEPLSKAVSERDRVAAKVHVLAMGKHAFNIDASRRDLFGAAYEEAHRIFYRSELANPTNPRYN